MLNTYFETQIKDFFRLEPTFQQEKALKLLADFLLLRSNNEIFLLKGYAGTGKTSLVSALVKTLCRLKQPVVLLAPTGRAAKVFSLYSEHPAYTIHRKIYRERSFDESGGSFSLNFNTYKHSLFIVDEASMIANSGLSGAVFGSGRLLDDLLEFVYSGEGCKLILLGDSAQLPPIGESESPALNENVLKAHGLSVCSIELTEVVRQSEDSGILYNATLIRNLLCSVDEDTLPIAHLKAFADIKRLPGEELIETISTSYSRMGGDETMVICKSNKRATIYNNGIRNQILGREDILSAGDRLMISKNNYFWTEKIKEIDFIANGDMVVVRRVRNVRELYGFTFADVTVVLPDYADYELEVTVLIDTLQNDSPSLSKEQMEQLYMQVMSEYADISTKKERQKMLRSDIYFNALQVKYAYAVTCHKAQGGQWSHVYLDQGYLPDDCDLENYYHWLYTAFTRATECLYLVNWPLKQTDLDE